MNHHVVGILVCLDLLLQVADVCKSASLTRTCTNFTIGRRHEVVRVRKRTAQVGGAMCCPSVVFQLKAQLPFLVLPGLGVIIFRVRSIEVESSSSSRSWNDLTSLQNRNNWAVQRTALLNVELLFAHNEVFSVRFYPVKFSHRGAATTRLRESCACRELSQIYPAPIDELHCAWKWLSTPPRLSISQSISAVRCAHLFSYLQCPNRIAGWAQDIMCTNLLKANVVYAIMFICFQIVSCSTNSGAKGLDRIQQITGQDIGNFGHCYEYTQHDIEHKANKTKYDKLHCFTAKLRHHKCEQANRLGLSGFEPKTDSCFRVGSARRQACQHEHCMYFNDELHQVWCTKKTKLSKGSKKFMTHVLNLKQRV